MLSIRLSLLCVAVGLLGCRRSSEARPEHKGPPTAEEAGRARVERQTKVAEVAPAPLPTALPLAGKEGTDADGYPLQYVDRAALRSLLRAQRYDDLTRYFEQLQSAFEADPKKEYWPHDAAAAFMSAEPELLPLLDGWVSASPKSFAPYLARGAYREHVGFTRRGTAWAAETHEGDFAGMADAHKKGFADLEEALSIRPRAVSAYELEIAIHMANSLRGEVEKDVEKAARVCPTCLLYRVRMMHALEPRWGGTHEAMAAFAKAAPVAQNKVLRFLPAYIELDQASMLQHDKKYDEAVAATERACSIGDYWKSLLDRGEAYERASDFAKAARDVERANQLRPGEPEVLFPLARAEYNQKHWETAGQALITGLRIDPTNHEGRRLRPIVVQGLLYASGEQFRAGHKNESLGLVELAIGLDPDNHQATGQKTWILTGPGPGPNADELEKLKTQAAAAPNDLRAHQALDYALARQRRFPEVVEMWTHYLDANPKDGMAHLERGGAYFNLGRRAEAAADAQAACDLGVNEGCARAKMIR